MRSMTSRYLLCGALLLAVSGIAEAQIGIGGRLSTVRGNEEAGTSSVRFTGGQLRAGLSNRNSIELALDTNTETNEAETVRIRENPFQASVLLFPVRSSFSPFLLGGVGWYSTRVEQLEASEVIDSVTTRRRGYHAGFGAEIRLGRHAGLHGDYRYTFLNFGDDDEEEEDTSILDALNPGSAVSRFLPSSEGSMWTVGLTVYF
jgi:opacity protein-like surface antigen